MPTAPKKVYNVSNKGRVCPQVLRKFTAFLSRGGVPTAPKEVYSVCPQVLRKFTTFLTRGGVPTAPKEVYSVSNKGRRVPTDPNKVYSVSTRGGGARDHQDVAPKPNRNFL